MKFFFIAVLLISSTLFASENHLLTIHRTDKKEIINMKIVTNDFGDLEGIKVISTKRIQYASVEDILNTATLFKQKGIKVILLKSHNLDKQLGGIVDLVFLKKFRIIKSNIYDSVTLEIVKDKNDKWILLKDKKALRSIFITPYTWGIEKISFN